MFRNIFSGYATFSKLLNDFYWNNVKVYRLIDIELDDDDVDDDDDDDDVDDSWIEFHVFPGTRFTCSTSGKYIV